MFIDIDKVKEASKIQNGAIRRTPLVRSHAFERCLASKHPIYFKAENLQYTGSFKVRGALNKIVNILPAAKKNGVVTASAGNHAQGVAFHCQRLGISAKIVMPEVTPLVKVRSTRDMGAEIILKGESYQEAYQEALRIQKTEGREYVHAFDDEAVVIGQATLGLEIYEDLPEIDCFVSPIGGGGLLGGAGAYLKQMNSKLKIMGVQAAGCSTFGPSLKAGKPVTLERVDTIAEGMSAKRMGDLTFELCKKVVDEYVVVTDEEISEGLLWILENERLFVEGCGGATVAAILKRPDFITGPSVILLSGGNLDVNLLARIIERGLVKSGRRVKFEATIPDVPGSLEKLIHILAQEKASILQIGHERVFSQTSLREVNTYVEVETEGLEHVARLKSALQAGPWPVRFSN